jgi:predicted RNA-binding Zn-ribbon protein involved in translation (DUF1610 family)
MTTRRKIMKENEGKWIIVSITIKCPKCGRGYTSYGEDAKSELNAAYVDCDCGFKGEINPSEPGS